MSSKRNRPKLPLVSEETRRWSALLAEEVCGWPGVTTRLMFGFRAVYRDGVAFVMLPDKRSLEVANAIAYKEGGEWKSFEMRDETDIGAAMRVLRKAYEQAG